MKKCVLLFTSFCLGLSSFAQDNEAEAALVSVGASYWQNWYDATTKTIYNSDKELCDNYLLWDSYWDVDDQTTNVQVLKGLTPKNGIVVEESSITNGTSYAISYDGDIIQAKSNKKEQYEKFGIRWMSWDGECDNYQLVNPITGQKWANNCHKTAKGYSVDFSEPANRMIQFQYQLVSSVEDPTIRVDLWDLKGRKSSVSDGNTVISHVKTVVEPNNTYLSTDPDSWHLFQAVFCDPYEVEELEEYADLMVGTVGDICDQAYWWNGVNFTINGKGYQAPFNVLLDLEHIIGIEMYVNDELSAGNSDLYIKDLVIGNNITRNTDNQTEYVPTAISTIDNSSEIEIVDGVVYSEGKIEVVDILGKTVKSAKQQLDVKDLPAGIYFIKTIEGTARFVK